MTQTVDSPNRQTRMKRLRQTTLFFLLSLLFCSVGQAKVQEIKLHSGWNLISIAVEPENPDVSVVFNSISANFDSAWSYDTLNQEWAVYPAPVGIPGVPTFNTVELGKGYWVKVNGEATLKIQGKDIPTPGNQKFYPGWNLVGFAIEQPVDFQQLLNGVPYNQVWTYNALSGEFKGVELSPGTDTILRQEFIDIQPGLGYWVYADEQATIGPVLGTALPGDVDVPPLLEAGPYGERRSWDPGEGDEDINKDGYHDTPETQRAIHFYEEIVTREISIFNDGNGILNWEAEIVDPEQTPWLYFVVVDETTGKEKRVVKISGSQAGEVARVKLLIDRSGLAPSAYTGKIRVISNGMGNELEMNMTGSDSSGKVLNLNLHEGLNNYSATHSITAEDGFTISGSDTVRFQAGQSITLKTGFSATDDSELSATLEPVYQKRRELAVLMNVGNIIGDYKLMVKIDEVEYGSERRVADMHNPRMHLSLYKDQTGIRGIIDPDRTLLMSRRFYMAGVYFEDSDNRFSLSGSIVIPARGNDATSDQADYNPYNENVQRDITLIGTRAKWGERDMDGKELGPLDIKGEYRETLWNALDEPIYLRGTFTAVRQEKTPLNLDQVSEREPGQALPDNPTEPNELTSTINIAEKMIINEVNVSVNLTHNTPEDLKISLLAPHNTSGSNPIILREENSKSPVGKMSFNGLTDFKGDYSNGDWTLKVLDTNKDGKSGDNERLIDWNLHITGTKVYDISGDQLDFPNGTTVVLTGCGIMETTTIQGGIYQFKDLIDCNYKIAIEDPAYEKFSTTLTINGSDRTVKFPEAQRRYSETGKTGGLDFTFAPTSGSLPLNVIFTSLTDIEQLGSGNYHYRWTVYKHGQIETPIMPLSVDGIPVMLPTGPEAPVVYTVEGNGFQVEHTFIRPGVYWVDMEIFRNGEPFKKLTSTVPIIVGNLSSGEYKLPFYTTSGGAGLMPHPANPAVQDPTDPTKTLMPSLYIMDSATFDIDRLPLGSDTPGLEDTNVFESGIDPTTFSNKQCSYQEGNGVDKDKNGRKSNGTYICAGEATKLNPPAGSNSHRILINIGMPIIGTSYSGENNQTETETDSNSNNYEKLDIGSNP